MSTLYSESTSGKSTAISLWANPIWDFSITFDHLQAREMGYTAEGQVPVIASLNNFSTLEANDPFGLLGFFLSVKGRWDTWLFDDVTDNFLAQALIGTGDGVTTAFQALRSIGGFTEDIQNLNGTPVNAGIWAASTSQAANTLVVPTITGIKTQFGLVNPWQTLGWPNYFKSGGGTTGTTEPNWRAAPIPTMTLVDGSVTWTNMGVPTVVYLGSTPQATSAYSISSTGLITFTSAPTSTTPIYLTSGFYFRCRFKEDAQSLSQFLTNVWGGSCKFSSVKI